MDGLSPILRKTASSILKKHEVGGMGQTTLRGLRPRLSLNSYRQSLCSLLFLRNPEVTADGHKRFAWLIGPSIVSNDTLPNQTKYSIMGPRRLGRTEP